MFKKPIINLTINLESLLDFVHLLDTYLNEQREEAIRLHASGLGPLLLAMQKLGVLPAEMTEQLLPEDKLKERIKEKLAVDVNIRIVEKDGGRRASIDISGEGE